MSIFVILILVGVFFVMQFVPVYPSGQVIDTLESSEQENKVAHTKSVVAVLHKKFFMVVLGVLLSHEAFELVLVKT